MSQTLQEGLLISERVQRQSNGAICKEDRPKRPEVDRSPGQERICQVAEVARPSLLPLTGPTRWAPRTMAHRHTGVRRVESMARLDFGVMDGFDAEAVGAAAPADVYDKHIRFAQDAE